MPKSKNLSNIAQKRQMGSHNLVFQFSDRSFSLVSPGGLGIRLPFGLFDLYFVCETGLTRRTSTLLFSVLRGKQESLVEIGKGQ